MDAGALDDGADMESVLHGLQSDLRARLGAQHLEPGLGQRKGLREVQMRHMRKDVNGKPSVS